jgi:UDP-glucose:(heptosyl)LPS alpha-1,3-glucosyltransferase
VRLRVAVLNRVFRTTGGGAETYSIRIVEHLAARHDIRVFAQEFEHEWPGVEHVRVPRPFKRPRWMNQLWYALYTWHATRRGFDVVHSHENTWHGAIQTIHVWPVRADLLGDTRGWTRMLRWLRIAASPRLLANLALEASRFRAVPGRHIVSSSDALRAQCAGSYPRSAAAMSVITPGVNAPCVTLSASQARAALGLPATGAVVLFVANDFGRKGLHALLGAMARLPDDVLLVVVGEGEPAPYWGTIRGFGLAARLHILGPRKDMGTVYRAATVLAHPTLSDTFAMAVLEAMSYGVPAVVSGAEHCGISALLRDGEDALVLADPRDEAALAQALRRVLTDEALAAKLRENGQRFAAGHTWEEAARKFEALYRASVPAGR